MLSVQKFSNARSDRKRWQVRESNQHPVQQSHFVNTVAERGLSGGLPSQFQRRRISRGFVDCFRLPDVCFSPAPFGEKSCRRAIPSPVPTRWELCRTSAATKVITGPPPEGGTPGCQPPWACTLMRPTTSTPPAWRGRMDHTRRSRSPRIW